MDNTELTQVVNDALAQAKKNGLIIGKETIETMISEAVKSGNNEAMGKLEELKKAQIEQGLKLEKTQKPELKNIQSRVKSFFDENHEAIKDGYKGDGTSFTLKAIDASDFTSHTSKFENPYIAELAQGMPFMLEILRNSIQVSADNRGSIMYIEQLAATNNAAEVAENAVPSESNYTFIQRTLAPAKIKAFVKVSTDQLYDKGFLQTQVNRLIAKDWMLKAHDHLLNGDGQTNKPFGLLHYATAFDADAAPKVDDAWLLDLINAMILQIEVDGKNSFTPNLAFLRNQILHEMRTKKDAIGNYMNLNWALGANMNISGVQLLGNQLAGDNQIVVGDISKAQLYLWEGMEFDVYQEQDDRSKDLVTLKVKGRMNLVVPENDKKAIVKCTDYTTDLATITAAGN